MTQDVVAAARELLTTLASGRERRLLWLAGGADWTLTEARALAACLHVPDTRWLGRRDGPADPNRRTADLGGECGLLIVDVWAGLDLDALGAAVGTLRGGGLLVLLTPPIDAWPTRADPAAERFATFPYAAADVGGRMVQRLCRLLDASAAVRRLDGPAARDANATPIAAAFRARDAAPSVAAGARDPSPRVPAVEPPLDLVGANPVTDDQARAVDAVVAAARSRACQALVITADRGRGKSAAMGLAAARLRTAQNRRILLTAPRRSAAAAVLRHAGEPVRYLPPDALLTAKPAADLLLVDEAAAIPAPLLEAMLLHYPRVVFATTVHGYEGTGRGFDVRFRAVLHQHSPGWRALRLSTPIRWAAGDPLEALVNRALLLDAEPVADDEATAALAGAGDLIRIETPDRDQLAHNERQLGQAFGLLVLGHYQTRPSDLRRLLDAPDIAVHLLRAGETVLATAVSGREGGLPSDLLVPIFEGRRRPQGHLLPQTLSAHAGLFDAPALACRRILRIAVHPATRRRGLGRRLLTAIAAEAAAEGADLIGASFGATPELVRFWRRCGMHPVHIGSRRNAASGAHAAVLLRALTPAGTALLTRGRERLLPRLGVLLSGPLRDLSPELVAALIAGAPCDPTMPTADDLRELHAFAETDRALDATRPALHRLLQTTLPQALATTTLPKPEAAALITCGLQQHEPTAAAHLLGATGAAAVLRALRLAVARLLQQTRPA
ncbi:MAG: GNAT family N-acetyltransferase [Thiohalocapsa sp.]